MSSPAYAALTPPKVPNLKQVPDELLDNDTLLLEYSLGEERSYVWAVGAGSLAAYELPKRSEIERVARKVRDILMVRNELRKGQADVERLSRAKAADAQYAEAAAELSQMILGPVASLIGNKRLLIVSDGILQYVPFSALAIPSPGDTPRQEAASWTPLIRDHEVVNLPSISVLAALKKQSSQRAPAAGAVAVLADPVFDAKDPRVHRKKTSATVPSMTESAHRGGEETFFSDQLSKSLLLRSAGEISGARGGTLFPRLPFAKAEADAILHDVPVGQGMRAVDFAASRATATSPELSHYRIVHFATHGLLNSEHPELSGLVLSLVDKDGKEQNGFFSLSDIYNLDLHADLVVLSACETGLGKEIQGEGLVGIARGFMYAGASRVVASLWKVDDAATAELMKLFYRGMLKDRLSPAAALQRAQMEMSKRWPSPYYWAGFVLLGQP
jgi:CHAT domain-containing protein